MRTDLPVLIVLALVTLLAPACASRSIEATSLDGTPLVQREFPPEREAELQADLDDARAVLATDPDDVEATIWVGRRLGYLWRYREAVDVFTRAIELEPDNPRPYRHRGHRWITLREYDRAIKDLEQAAALIADIPDEVEQDGAPNAAGIPTSTLHTNVWYHLGLARYLTADFNGALYAYERCLAAAGNDDMRVATLDWMYLTLRRLGHDDHAARLLEMVGTEMDLVENFSYHRRLLMYKGELSVDDLIPSEGEGDRALELATYGYGVGAFLLLEGDPDGARRVFEEVTQGEYWPAFGYIASEAELARWPSPEGDAASDAREGLRVLVWNIQRGAKEFDDGPEKALAIIRDVDPDVCLLQESYDIEDERPTLGRWMAAELGWNTYQDVSPHLCVLTRLDIDETFFHADWHGLGARLRDEHGRELIAYSIWLDYRSYTPHALRDDPDATDEDLLANETEHSDRLGQAKALLAHLDSTSRSSPRVPLLVGGDFNCPSHLDWTEETAKVYRSRRSLPLPVSIAFRDAGFEDAFRLVHPEPVQHPGITWSPLFRGTVETPETAERIDRLYLHRRETPRLVPVAARVLPVVYEHDSIPQAQRAFPSDHGCVVIDFEWVR